MPGPAADGRSQPGSYPYHKAEQERTRAFFFAGRRTAKEVVDPAEALPLGQVDPLARSEVCELMAALFARGKDAPR